MRGTEERKSKLGGKENMIKKKEKDRQETETDRLLDVDVST
jgi:hypothetical protein